MGVGRSVGRGWGLAILVVVLLGALLPTAPASAAAPTPWPETRLTTEHWYGEIASALDAQGRVHYAARRAGVGSGVRYLRPQGDTWVEEAVAPDTRAWQVAIAFDPRGAPVIAWSRGRQIRIATRTADGRWMIESIASGVVVGERFRLVIDGDGHRHLAWFKDRGSRLFYATDRGGSWWRTSMGPVDSYTSPGLAVTRGGVAWLSASVERDDCCSRGRIRVVRIEDRAVTMRRLGDGYDPQVVLDDQERPAVAWSGHGLRIRRFIDGRWQTALTLHRGAHPIFGLHLSGDRLDIAYDDFWDGVTLARHDASGWRRTQIVRGWACPPSDLYVVERSTVLLPCAGSGDGTPGATDGLHLRTVTSAGTRIEPVAREERYSRAITAQAPDGHLEVLTGRTDGRLALHRQTPSGWTTERIPSMLPAYPTGFTIGPDGDRAIIGESRWSRLFLLSDRGGTWQRTRLGAGYGGNVTIDRDGRYHVGYVRKDGWRRTLWVLVGTPGAWQRSQVPRSLISDFSRETFLVEPDGTDAVVWARRGDRDGKNGGIRLARWDGTRWTVDRLGHDGYTELWSAAMAPDGTIGIVRGGLLSNNLQLIRGDQRTMESLPGVTFFGGSLLFDSKSRPAILAQGWDLGRLLILRKFADGWHRITVIEDRWEEARLAMTGSGPAVLIGRHEDRSRVAGWFVLTQPS